MKKMIQAYKEHKALFAASTLVCLMLTAIFILAVVNNVGDMLQPVSGFFTAAAWIIFYVVATAPLIEDFPKDLSED